jgi:hypothetical protein
MAQTGAESPVSFKERSLADTASVTLQHGLGINANTMLYLLRVLAPIPCRARYLWVEDRS